MKPLLCALLFVVTLHSGEAQTSVEETKDEIILRNGDSEILRYQKSLVPPPEGVDRAYARSGFVHPIRTPRGATITGIHPDDHYHHLGIWHAWVKTEWNGQEIDFWNLKKQTGGVRYAKTLAIGKTSFTVQQDHYALDKNLTPTVILQEELTVRATEKNGAFEIDYNTVQKNVSRHALKLPQYRYGGPLAYRGPAHWNVDNSKCLTSTGKTRVDGHESRGNWVSYSGPSQPGSATNASIAILCHKDNHDAPQRMRIWPPKSNNGAVFFNFVPIQETGWEIKPGETSSMKYRIVTTDGEMEPADINQRWNAYTR